MGADEEPIGSPDPRKRGRSERCPTTSGPGPRLSTSC